MPRRPPIPPADALAAADRIAARRIEAQDPDLGLLPDDLEGIAAHVYRRPQVPANVLAADVEDGLLIVAALRTLLDRHELGLLRAGRSINLTYLRLGTMIGQRDRQGVLGRMRRLEAGLAGLPKDASLMYESARAARADAELERSRGARLVRLAVDLAMLINVMPDDVDDDVEEIREAAARILAGEPAEEVLAARLRLLLADLAGRQDWTPNTKLRAALEDGAQLLGTLAAS